MFNFLLFKHFLHFCSSNFILLLHINTASVSPANKFKRTPRWKQFFGSIFIWSRRNIVLFALCLCLSCFVQTKYENQLARTHFTHIIHSLAALSSFTDTRFAGVFSTINFMMDEWLLLLILSESAYKLMTSNVFFRQFQFKAILFTDINI